VEICFYLLYYNECKRIYCPEPLFVIKISKNITHFYTGRFSFHSPLFSCIDHCAVTCFEIRLCHSQFHITGAINTGEQKYILSYTVCVSYCIHQTRRCCILRLHKVRHIAKNRHVHKSYFSC
jgi:hypothetical protein